MRLSDLLQEQPRITLALIEESAGAHLGNGSARGRYVTWYDAKLTYCYEQGDSGLGVSVECVAKYDPTTGVAAIERFEEDSSNEIWATNVYDLEAIENAHSFFVDNLTAELKGFNIERLFKTVPFTKTTTFELAWI